MGRIIYQKLVQFLSPVVLGVLAGVITGLVINLLTNDSSLKENRAAIQLFSASVFPLLVLLHIRDEWQFTYLNKIAAGGKPDIAWSSTLSKSATRKDWVFLVTFLIFCALIFFGVRSMKKPEGSISKPGYACFFASE